MTWLVHHASSPKVYRRLQYFESRHSHGIWHSFWHHSTDPFETVFWTHIFPNIFRGWICGFWKLAFIQWDPPCFVSTHEFLDQRQPVLKPAWWATHDTLVTDVKSWKGRKMRDKNRAVRHRVVGSLMSFRENGSFFFFGWGDGGSPYSCLVEAFF